jgi:hypothetical protein
MAQTQRPIEPEEPHPGTNPALVQSPSGERMLIITSGHNGTSLYLLYIFSELTLTIQPGQDGVKPLTLLTQDVQRLQFVLAECKRLKEMAGMSSAVITSLDTPGRKLQ